MPTGSSSRSSLWLGANAPAFEDDDVNGGLNGFPCRFGGTIVNGFVEARQEDGFAANQRLYSVDAQFYVMGAGYPASGQQGMNVGGQLIAFGLGKIQIVNR